MLIQYWATIYLPMTNQQFLFQGIATNGKIQIIRIILHLFAASLSLSVTSSTHSTFDIDCTTLKKESFLFCGNKYFVMFVKV